MKSIPRWPFSLRRAMYPMLLGGLVLSTAFSILKILLAPQLSPLPRWTYPETVAFAGYEVRPLPDEAGFKSKAASHGPLRRFLLQAKGNKPPVLLSLFAVRSHDRQELAREAFGQAHPNLRMKQRRLLVLQLGTDGAGGEPGQELALGRGTADPAYSTTRLQTCLTPAGQAAVSESLLVAKLKQQRNRDFQADPLGSLGSNLLGEPWSRWECLVVQLQISSTGNHEVELQRAWQQLRPQLVPKQ